MAVVELAIPARPAYLSLVRLVVDAAVGSLAPGLSAARLDDMMRGGRNGTRSTILVLLGDVHAALGEPDLARETYQQARQDPGPYRQLFVDLLDRRIASLPRERTRRGPNDDATTLQPRRSTVVA